MNRTINFDLADSLELPIDLIDDGAVIQYMTKNSAILIVNKSCSWSWVTNLRCRVENDDLANLLKIPCEPDQHLVPSMAITATPMTRLGAACITGQEWVVPCRWAATAIACFAESRAFDFIFDTMIVKHGSEIGDAEV